jgi:carboxymethylenebutenolidase
MGASLQWRDRKEPTNERRGEMVSFGSRRDSGRGYMATSARVGPSVLLLHGSFGLTQSFCDLADALNEHGFTVLVPDLYDGKIATSVDMAIAAAESLDRERTPALLEAAAGHLTANWHPILGIVGSSLGASLATDLCTTTTTEAAVLYYGYGQIDVDDWRTPLLVHLAEDDDREPDAGRELAGWVDAGLDVDVHVYGGTGHWFADADVPHAFDQSSAALAFDRTVDFLRYHLA